MHVQRTSHRTPRRSPPATCGGFSLLEMVVAVAILAISLSVMYRVAGGATRSVGVDERMAYAVELARSLRAVHAVVPVGGLDVSGATEGDFRWQVTARPIVLDGDVGLEDGQLQELSVAVRWSDGEREREFSSVSVVAGVEERE